MRTFYRLLATALLALTTNNFVIFALTFWGYLTTRSVIFTSVLGGLYLVIIAIASIWLGSIVDHHKKKHAMLASSCVSLVLFAGGWALVHFSDPQAFSSVGSVRLWIVTVMLLCGLVAGNIYNIAIPTVVGLTVPEERRDRANGMFGTVVGIAFAITSVASGLTLGFGTMDLALAIAVGATVVVIVTLSLIRLDEPVLAHLEGGAPRAVDLKGTVRIVRTIPGLAGLIFFTTFNNFLGGVFIALMDAYGLSLVTVQIWGLMWGVLSLGLIAGGLAISRFGLGRSPLATLFKVNFVIWAACIFFPIQPSVTLLMMGVFTWMFSFPYIEAIEQTILQKVVPPERLGRVIGFAHSVEQSASPFTAFLIGPVAQLVFIPFMTTGRGVRLIGDWFGTGQGRGIALVFMAAGLAGVIMTALAKRSRSYRLLSSLTVRPSEGAGEPEAAPATEG